MVFFALVIQSQLDGAGLKVTALINATDSINQKSRQIIHHIEVFDSKGNFSKVLNLDGTINRDKTLKGLGRVLK